MQLTALLNGVDSADERAVSPVIGVILMVAITVILAALIGTFVLGLGQDVQNDVPQASFTFDYEKGATGADCSLGGSGVLTVTHDGGDTLDPATLNVSDGAASAPWDGGGDSACALSSADVASGSGAEYGVDGDDTVRVIWTASGGGESATLGKWTGPE